MGAKAISPPAEYITVSRKDENNESILNKQWDQFRSEFLKPDHVLIYHLKNHYALIFAIREWYTGDVSSETKTDVENTTDSGSITTTTTTTEEQVPETSPRNMSPRSNKREHVRQILTARRGQRYVNPNPPWFLF